MEWGCGDVEWRSGVDGVGLYVGPPGVSLYIYLRARAVGPASLLGCASPWSNPGQMAYLGGIKGSINGPILGTII